MINWHSEENIFCINKKCQNEHGLKPDLKGHFIIATSGSQSKKWVALSKQAMLISASSVNHMLDSNHQDKWIQGLPDHHVGGLSIKARAFLSGAKVFEVLEKWNPYHFVNVVKEVKGTLSSLVPTQVFDIVQHKIYCPQSLRAIIVGGGALSSLLYEKAKELGWPVLPSYGLTECSSQVATAKKNDPSLQILPHISVKVNERGSLSIKSEALLTGYLYDKNGCTIFIDPKENGWFHTEDRVELQGITLNVLGRIDKIVKVCGEQVNLSDLELILEKICFELDISYKAALIALPDARIENSLCLVLEEKYRDFAEKIQSEFLKQVLPYEKIRTIRYIQKIPRNSLGKVIYSNF